VISEEEWMPLDPDAQRIVEASVEFAKTGTDSNPADAQERLRGAVMKPAGSQRKRRPRSGNRRREEKPMERVAIVAHLKEGNENRAAELIARAHPSTSPKPAWSAITSICR
jgi:hypothetical protein